MNEPRTLERFWKEQHAWSQATFGPTSMRGPIGPLKHLAKEVQEVIQDPDDLVEYIDCLFMLFDAMQRRGMRLDDVIQIAFGKLEINRARQWPKPTTSDPVEHIRE